MAIGVTIKSNVMIKPKFKDSREIVPPMDLLKQEYFDVRLGTVLTTSQQNLLEKMMFWAERVYDDEGNLYEDRCYKGCHDCGQPNNHCKRPQNKQ